MRSLSHMSIRLTGCTRPNGASAARLQGLVQQPCELTGGNGDASYSSSGAWERQDLRSAVAWRRSVASVSSRARATALAWSRALGVRCRSTAQRLVSPTVSQELSCVYVTAARTARSAGEQPSAELMAQCGDGVLHVSLRALGCRAECNPGEG